MTTAFDRASLPARPTVTSPSSKLSNWTLVRARAHQDLAQLQGWIANEADANELNLVLSRTPHLFYATAEHAIQKRWLSKAQVNAATHALAEERTSASAFSLLLGAPPEAFWTVSQGLAPESARRSDCALSASGAIAGYWACQVHLAAAVEKAMARLGMRGEMLHYKRKHSARCARSLLEWEAASNIDLRAFPGTHRVASGISSMVDKYCAVVTSPVAM